MFYHSLFISSLNSKFYLYFSNPGTHNFSKLKIALGRKRSIFDGTIKTFHDIISLTLNIKLNGQSL